MKASLLLENGAFFQGESFGYGGMSGGELVFNTAMTGYQEILTDPSYAGQIVLMTYPLIGNYGANTSDMESARVWAKGLVVREYTNAYSNWRAEKSLSEFLIENEIVAMEGVDSRALTRQIRSQGSLRAVLATEGVSREAMHAYLQDVPPMEGRNLVTQVAAPAPYVWPSRTEKGRKNGDDAHVVVVDCGVKRNILRSLAKRGVRLTVLPPTRSAEAILALKPDVVLLSNGPGDPDAVPNLPQTIGELIGKIPLYGICLGHQLLAKAIGARTYKLKFGHHGGNHPVRNEETGRIEITSQNHGFAVCADSLMALDGGAFGRVRITHWHLSDETVEGFELPEVGVRAIQYHPEAAPGPHDATYFFDGFLKKISQPQKQGD